MTDETRNYRFEAQEILRGRSRLLPTIQHLEAQESVIISLQIANRELHEALMDVLENTEQIDRQLSEAMDLLSGPVRES
jgi:hypothetical protein